MPTIVEEIRTTSISDLDACSARLSSDIRRNLQYQGYGNDLSRVLVRAVKEGKTIVDALNDSLDQGIEPSVVNQIFAELLSLRPTKQMPNLLEVMHETIPLQDARIFPESAQLIKRQLAGHFSNFAYSKPNEILSPRVSPLDIVYELRGHFPDQDIDSEIGKALLHTGLIRIPVVLGANSNIIGNAPQ